MNYSELLEHLGQQAPTFLEEDGTGGYICPSCSSGDGSKHTGLREIPERKSADGRRRWKCFACDEGGGDVVDLMQQLQGCDFDTAVKACCSYYGISSDEAMTRFDTPTPQRRRRKVRAEDSKAAESLQEFVEIEQSPAAYEYMRSRGFEPSFLKVEGLRADARGNVVIPYPGDAEGYYFKRGSAGDFKQAKPNARRRLYNVSALSGSTPVFIVEGEIDALAIKQAGGVACALGSTANCNMLLDQEINAPLILSLDNDEAGQQAQRKLAQALQVSFLQANVSGECKDPAQRLQEDARGLASAVSEAVENAERAEPVKGKAKTLQQLVGQLAEAISSGAYRPVSTGVAELDEIMGGGLVAKTLVSISAAPAVGKTILAQVLADNLAKSGAQVLYACLEMSAEQMTARTISREAYFIDKLKAPDVSSVFSSGGLKRAANALKSMQQYQCRMHYTDTTRTIQGILAEARAIEQETGEAPYIFVDYLQLLQDDTRRDAVDTIKEAITLLKDYVNEKGVCAFVIVADNREAAKTGKSNLFSGRDTSAIEYGADYAISLSFTVAVNHIESDIDEIRNDPNKKRAVTLRVNKNRYGVEGKSLNLTMWGEYATFEVNTSSAPAKTSLEDYL